MAIRVCMLLAVGVTTTATAQIDADVQWNPVSHIGFTDRRPLCPLNGEAFEVILQTARVDLTGARVGIDYGADGGELTWVDLTRGEHTSRYDLWRGIVPATSATRLSYFFELIDEPDRDYLSTSGVSDDPPTTHGWLIDFATLSHAPLGATPTSRGTVFRVWAPNATSCFVRGTFNGWGLGNPLSRQGEYYVGVVANARPNDEYKYFFNNRDWRPDPRGRFLNNAVNYNSRIIDPFAYVWQHPNFEPAPRDRWVVYQLHVGTFAGLNDPLGSFTRPARYREVADRADHLLELGVNAVMLNPIHEFPGQQSGGYNSLTQWAFESTYGSPDDLKSMVDALHARGIAVLLDSVWNHLPSTDNFLWNYDGTQIYFDTPAVGTPWGSQADIDRAPVFDFYLDSAELVLGEYKMDGYRQDAVYELISATQYQAGQRLIRALTDRVHRRYADAHVIGEIYNNSPWNTSPAGMNMDGQYHEAYKNAIQDAIEAAAFGDPDMGRLAASLDGSGPWVEGDRVLNYYELHDEAWPLSGPGRTRAVRRIDTVFPHDDRYASGRTKLANGLTLLSRGMPAILQGTEWLEDNGWETEKIDWSNKTRYREIFRFYRELIGLRTARPALFANSPARVYHVNEAANVIVFERYDPSGGSFVCAANFSNVNYPEYLIGLPRGGRWDVILNSESAIYRGLGIGSPAGQLVVEPVARDGFPQRTTLQLPPHGFLLLEHEPLVVPVARRGDMNCDAVVDFLDMDGFVMALVGEAAYLAVYPDCRWLNGDVDDSDAVDFADIDGFVACLVMGCE